MYFKQFCVNFLPLRAASQNALQRHRMVNAALADEFEGGLHALSLTTRTPEELPQSP